MVLGDYLDSLFSNDIEESPSLNFPQGKQFNTLQHGKMMRHQARADRLIDPNGFSVEHTLQGQRALGGQSINMETNLSVIEGFDTATDMETAPTAIAQRNRQEKATRTTLSQDAVAQTAEYKNAVADLLKATKEFADKPPELYPPTNSYIAQSVPNPTSAGGNHAVGSDYVPTSKSGLGNASQIGSSDTITCALGMKDCVTMCQARTFDEGGVGFMLSQPQQLRQGGVGNLDSVPLTCTPITQQADFDNIQTSIGANDAAQHGGMPGGSWWRTATAYDLEGDVLVASLLTEDHRSIVARVKVVPGATYSNINGSFRQDLNGEAGMESITFTDPPPGYTGAKLENNTLIVTAEGGMSL